MKKLIFILSIIALTAIEATAQGVTAMTTRRLGIGGTAASGTYVSTVTKTVDTCTNAVDTVYFFYNAANLKNGSLELLAQRISGTCVVTGYLECSNNGVDWWQKSLADTVNLKPTADYGQAKGLNITQNNCAYYRWRIVGHNTAAVRLRGNVCVRRD